MKWRYGLVAAAVICGCSDDGGVLKEAPIKVGDVCETHEDCGALRCADGACAEKLGNGNACVDAGDCLSGKCEGGVCARADETEPGNDAAGAAKGEACTQAEACAEGLVCHNQRCSQAANIGERCDEAFTYCAQGLCEYGVCRMPSGLKDTDGDTIPDTMDRCDEDTDGDTIPNCKDLDSDGDTIPDAVEAANGGNLAVAPMDTDGDTLPDFLSLDSDGNDIPDAFEGCPNADFPYTGEDAAQPTAVCDNPVDTDGDTVPDYRSFDNDGDGASDVSEMTGIFNRNNEPGRLCGGVVCAPGTAVNPWDTDGDTIPDYMSPDSDGDTIPDSVELYTDSNGDGVLDRYALDSDGDTLPDGQEVDANGKPLYYVSGGTVVYCFQTQDCDNDGVLDGDEPVCSGVSAMVTPDADNDGYDDASELAAGQYAVINGLLDGRKIDSADALVCDPNLGVQDVFEFYFELPYKGDEKNDTLEFIPKVSKLDVVFNVDTTGSMGQAINSVKGNVGNIIDQVRKMVSDSGFALTNFDDYPTGLSEIGYAEVNGKREPVFYLYGNQATGDLPFRVLGKISTDASIVESYTKNALFTTRDGADGAESGAESLYQIATGAGTSWNAGSHTGLFLKTSTTAEYQTHAWNAGMTPANVNAAGTWGGVDFRNGSLPIVIHTTDVYSHDQAGAYLPGLPASLAYNTHMNAVNAPHYTDDLIPMLQNKGIRVITLGVPAQIGSEIAADAYGQMTTWARESHAVVPVCAFDQACGANKCCLGTTIADPVSIDGKNNQCVLYYTSAQSDVSTYISQGVGALVKYGTYEVATRIEGEPIPGSSVTTACFIKQVVASQYLPPPQEPEKSCNPVAVPTRVNGADYNNGFANFAPGTASNDVEGARLHFTVIAQNDNCVPASSEPQIFRAYIDVINPTTGLSFGRRQVSIIVPPVTQAIVN